MGRRDGVTRPALPTGPLLELNNELHELHGLADYPSMRDLAKSMGPGVVSHTTVHETFVKPVLPRWGVLELIVRELVDRIPELEDPEPEVKRFRHLWRAAQRSLPRPVNTQDESAIDSAVILPPQTGSSPLPKPAPSTGDTVYFAMPSGVRMTDEFGVQNFDDLYANFYAPAIHRLGLQPERGDHAPAGSGSVLDTEWNAIQRAAVVVVDLTTQSTSVAMAYGWAMALHKRMIVLATDGSTLPSGSEGMVRPIYYSFTIRGLADAQRDLQNEVSALLQVPAADMRVQPASADHELSSRWAHVEFNDSKRILVRDVAEPLRVAALTDADLPEGDFSGTWARDFPVGKKLFGTFRFESASGTLRFIYQPDAWAADLAVGKLLPGRISRYVPERGFILVDLGPAIGVPALVHITNFNGLEPKEGMHVNVRIVMIDSKRSILRAAISTTA